MSADLQNVKLALQSKREEVLRRLHRLDEIAVERAADPVDELGLSTERESAITRLERDSQLLREIDSAFQRIADGDYGLCASCGSEISPRRLRVVPWAAYCVTCQEEVDRSRAPGKSFSMVES